MQTINLYKYNREGGGITVSPVKPNGEYFEMFRLVADEGKELTKDGVEFYPCVDVDSVDGWYEVDAPQNGNDRERITYNPKDTDLLQQYEEALNTLGVETEAADEAN